ncbi:hypothetical protein AB0K18_44975 [Nonomuraea sp. NPDC049421]|uniref:hypothetical protein n=1 Tax=Nonomuraea sp. NPDC049421 TaxID=3155275 RepID=UPI00341A4D16
MSAVVVVLLLAGLSESAGRILPLIARRPGVSRAHAVRLLLTGAVVEFVVFALWPWAAGVLAELHSPRTGAAPGWTPGLAAPLLLAAVVAFPLLGPLLHTLLIVAVGANLTGSLATATGLGWWSAAGCVAVAGVGLGVAVGGVRWLVVRISALQAVPA